jgi:hypothetical protein
MLLYVIIVSSFTGRIVYHEFREKTGS